MIRQHTINSDHSGFRILILAGVHGDEYEPMLAALQLLDELPELVVKGSITIVSVVNEAAYQSGGRCAEDGLDLARICPGNSNGSMTEQVAYEISVLIKETDYLIDMHTGGLLYDIYPMVGYMLHPDPKILKQQQEMALASGLPLIWGTDSRPDGRTLSVARSHGIPAVYFEYGGGTGVRKHVVARYKQSCMQILAHMGCFNTRFPPQEKYSYWLEDYRSESGHLQMKMPAVADGVFISNLDIGDLIRKGEEFGKIVNPVSKKVVQIIAEEDGLVFLLRASVYVKKGEALGGILPVELFRKKMIKENG